jgi:hypothetical protein
MHCYHDFTSHIGQASGVLPRFVDALGQQQQITACFQCLRLYTHLLTHQFFMCLTTFKWCGCAYGCVLTMILPLSLTKQSWEFTENPNNARQPTTALCSGWGWGSTLINNDTQLKVKHTYRVWKPSLCCGCALWMCPYHDAATHWSQTWHFTNFLMSDFIYI